MRIFNSLNAHPHLACFPDRFAATTKDRSVNGTEFVAAQFHDEFLLSLGSNRWKVAVGIEFGFAKQNGESEIRSCSKTYVCEI